LFSTVAAAGENEESDDDYPDDVVIVEDIAKAAVHGRSSYDFLRESGFSRLSISYYDE
jgi:hypothetical protein